MYAWNNTSIMRTLKDPINKGTLVLGKTKWVHKGRKRKLIQIPQEKWRIFEDGIPAVVDKETWDNVQEILSQRRRPRKNKTKLVPLSGLLYCGKCKSKMNVQTTRHQRQDGTVSESVNYQCSKYRVRGKAVCDSNTISNKDVEYVVLYKIRLLNEYARHKNNKLVDELMRCTAQNQRALANTVRNKINAAKKRYTELEELIISLYPNLAKGLLPENVYLKLLESYTMEQEGLTKETERLQQEQIRLEQENANIESFISLVKKEQDLSELTTELAVSFIDKIIIHKKGEKKGEKKGDKKGDKKGEKKGDKKGEKKGEKHGNERNIEIHFKFIGKLDIDPDFALASNIDGLGESERLRQKKYETL